MRIGWSQTTWIAAPLGIAAVLAGAHVSRVSRDEPGSLDASQDAKRNAEGVREPRATRRIPVALDTYPDVAGFDPEDETWFRQAPEFVWTNEATSYAAEHALPPLAWSDVVPPTGAPVRSDHAVTAAAWLATLPAAEGFQTAARDEPHGAGDTLSLTWQFDDLGPAKNDREGHHDHTLSLIVGWGGRAVTLPLDDTWMDRSSASYFDRRDGKSKPGGPLSSFVLESMRGSMTFEVHATPEGLVVIQEDTTPVDWIPECHETRQGPYTTCLETPWERIAAVPVALPPNVHLQERVVERDLATEHAGRFSLTPPPIAWLAAIPASPHFRTLSIDEAEGPWGISWVLAPDRQGGIGHLTLSILGGDASIVAFRGDLIGEPMTTSSFCSAQGQLPFLAKNLVSALDEGGASGATSYLLLAEPNVLHLLVSQSSDGACEESQQGPFTICDNPWSRLVDIRTKAGKTIEGIEQITLPEGEWACVDSSP